MGTGTLAPIPSLSPFDGDVANLGAALGDLTLMRNYCMASDTFVSIAMDAQRPAKDYFKDLFKACNCAPVFSEGVLKVIPWSEISQVGNGTVYVAPTATGPIMDLTPHHFIVRSAGEPPLKIMRPRLFDTPNVVELQFISHDREYNDGSVMASDTALIAQYGPIHAQPEKNEWIHDGDLARRAVQLLLWGGDPTDPSASNRGTIPRNRYSFVLPPHFALLEPMDLITVTDLSQGVYRHPVRLLTLKEQTDMTLDCEAEDFIYGAHASPGPPISAATLPTTDTGVGNSNADPGAVNPPYIFEPIPTADPLADGNVRIWIAVSGPLKTYGGCHIWMSTDGGTSYGTAPVGPVSGSAVMGLTLNDLPNTADPDTTDTVNVNLLESNGVLSPFTNAQEDLFLSLCYITPGAAVLVNGQSVTVPYEFIAYSTANLTGTSRYALGTRLRRGVYSSPVVDHPASSKFAFLDAHIFKITLPLSYIGKTLYFKFTAFNTVGAQEQNLSQAIAYAYTVTGWPQLGSGGFYVNGN